MNGAINQDRVGNGSDACGPAGVHAFAAQGGHAPATVAESSESWCAPRGRPPGVAETLDADMGSGAGRYGDGRDAGRSRHDTPGVRQEFETWQYELGGEIARGGMGVVYRARQKVLDREVAIKMILPDKSVSQSQIETLYAEARLAARLRHPNIVGVYEIGIVHGWHYIAMELVEGQSLAQRAGQASMDPEAVTRLLLSVVRAVSYLHAHGIVHLDIKPANILLDAEGVPYVTDFGIAKAFMTQAQGGCPQRRIAGTPNYMAPEQAAGKQEEVGVPSDIYSLGAVLYDLLTGHPPFEAATPSETLVQVLRAEPAHPRSIRSGIPPGLELICLKCLEKDPARRYPSAAALAEDLERFIEGEPVEARPLSPPGRLLRWTRRQPALALRLLAMGIFMTLEVAWFYPSGVTTRAFHLTLAILLPLWALASFGLNQRLRRSTEHTRCQLSWAVVDIAALTALCLASEQSIFGPLVVLYYILIADAGLWYRPKVVWIATTLSVTAYLGLLAEALLFRPEIVAPIATYIVPLAALIVIGITVSHLARCTWALRRLYGRV